MRKEHPGSPPARIAARSLALSVAALALAAGGCGKKIQPPPPRPTISHLRITHHTGSSHHRVLMHDGRWIQAFGCSVQVIDPRSLILLHDVPLGEFGRTGPVVDLAIVGERLYAVVEDDAVVELSLARGAAPRIDSAATTQTLGISPRRLSVIDGECFASGLGGVVNLADGRRYDAPAEAGGVAADCGRIARAAGELVVTVGRRTYRLRDGAYLGSASDLLSLPAEARRNESDAPLAFALQSAQSATAGLMTADLREIPDAQAATVAVAGRVQRLRWFNQRLWIVGSQRIAAYAIENNALRLAAAIPMAGALDVDRIDDRTIAIVGSSGRAAYRLGAGIDDGTFVAVEREPGRLTSATSDGLRVLAGSEDGAWMYLIGARAEFADRSFSGSSPPPRAASVLAARAQISEDGATLHIKPASTASAAPWDYREERGATMHTVIAVDGRLWIGHDRGITIISPQQMTGVTAQPGAPRAPAAATRQPSIAQLGGGGGGGDRGGAAEPGVERLRIPGPVRHLFPLLVGRGACYVSERGGFGVVRYIDEPLATPQ